MTRRTQSWLAILSMAAAMLTMATPTAAQFSPSYKFLDAVRKMDGEVVTKYAEAPGTTLINTRDQTTGETALLIVIARKDATWTQYMLSRGARTDIAAKNGRTPLMLAIEKRFQEGVELLLTFNANVNLANSQGETPLIIAVHMQDVPMVRLLIAHGANPDKHDSLTGMSAREYAARDARIAGMMEALNTAKPSAAPAAGARPVQGPGL